MSRAAYPLLTDVTLTFHQCHDLFWALAVNTCKDYECPYGYERKDDHEYIICDGDCDDDECCDQGDFSLSQGV